MAESAEDAANILAKAGYLKAEADEISVALESTNTVNIQPKGTILGARIKVEQNGLIVPSLTIDTKKLRDADKDLFPERLVDEALEDFFLKTKGEVC